MLLDFGTLISYGIYLKKYLERSSEDFRWHNVTYNQIYRFVQTYQLSLSTTGVKNAHTRDRTGGLSFSYETNALPLGHASLLDEDRLPSLYTNWHFDCLKPAPTYRPDLKSSHFQSPLLSVVV